MGSYQNTSNAQRTEGNPAFSAGLEAGLLVKSKGFCHTFRSDKGWYYRRTRDWACHWGFARCIWVYPEQND